MSFSLPASCYNKLVLTILVWSLFAQCASKNGQEMIAESNDPYVENFKYWLKSQSMIQDKYIVMQWGDCQYCDSKVLQSMVNFDCLGDQNRNKIAYIILSKERLPKMMENQLSKPNFFQYKDQLTSPLIEDYPRIYTVRKTKAGLQVEYIHYDAQAFGKALDQLCERTLEIDGVTYFPRATILKKGIPIPGDEEYMIECEEGTSIEEVNGTAEYYLRADKEMKWDSVDSY